MIDVYLAALYETETKKLKQQHTNKPVYQYTNLLFFLNLSLISVAIIETTATIETLYPYTLHPAPCSVRLTFCEFTIFYIL